jgi:hypothetical protein
MWVQGIVANMKKKVVRSRKINLPEPASGFNTKPAAAKTSD